jgi:hypothetical protein
MGAKITQPANFAKLLTGSYVGDGTDNRNINIGLDLASKSNVWVSIKCANNYSPQLRLNGMPVDQSLEYAASGYQTDKIQNLTSTGFQVGTNAVVNSNGVTYWYMVVYQD